MTDTIELKMRHLSGALVYACFIALAATGPASGAEVGVTDTSIKIGMFGPLTGAVSIYGYPINNGAIAIYKDINDHGGINGRKIEIVHEDGACDPAKTRAAVKKLIHSDKVFMVHGGNCSAAVVATRDEFIDNKVPFMVMAASLDAITVPTNKYLFTTQLTGIASSGVMMNFVKSNPKAKRIAVVRHNNEWANDNFKMVAQGYKAAGLELVADEQLDSKASDATTQVMKIKGAKPDVTLFVLYPGESAVFLRDAEKYGLKGPFVGTIAVQDLLDLAERAGSKTAVKDVYAVAYLRAPAGSPELAKYAEIYKKQFPNDKLQSISFFGMGSALTVAEALRRAGRDLTREKVVAALEGIKNGDAGPLYCRVNFSTEHHQGCLDGAVWTLRNDKIVNIGSTWPKK